MPKSRLQVSTQPAFSLWQKYIPIFIPQGEIPVRRVLMILTLLVGVGWFALPTTADAAPRGFYHRTVHRHVVYRGYHYGPHWRGHYYRHWR
jgi:hypothetical protein